jgi:hypothetical protein
LRTSEDDGFDASDFPWETMQDFHSYCAFLPSGFERYGILEISSQPATSPAYLARGIKTDCDHSYRRFYDGIWGDFSSWRTGGWSQGLLRMPGILGGLSLEQGSHNAIGASDSAIVPGIKLYTDNMMTMFVVNKRVSKSPVIMAELRRLHQL